MVFYHRIRLHDIGTDLVSPANLLDFTADTGKLLCILLLLQQIQLCFQHLHRFVFVHVLGTLILALNNDVGRQVGDTDRRGGLVDMLTAGSAGTVSIDTQIFIPDLDIDVFLNIRHDIAGYKRGLSLSSRIER